MLKTIIPIAHELSEITEMKKNKKHAAVITKTDQNEVHKIKSMPGTIIFTIPLIIPLIIALSFS